MVDNCETVVGIKCINLDTVLRPEWLAYSLAMMFISWEHILCQVGFPGGSDDKESAYSAEDHVQSWVRKITRERAWQPTPRTCHRTLASLRFASSWVNRSALVQSAWYKVGYQGVLCKWEL